jgi:hypothetical protein
MLSCILVYLVHCLHPLEQAFSSLLSVALPQCVQAIAGFAVLWFLLDAEISTMGLLHLLYYCGVAEPQLSGPAQPSFVQLPLLQSRMWLLPL